MPNAEEPLLKMASDCWGSRKRLRDGMCFIQIVCRFFSDMRAVSIALGLTQKVKKIEKKKQGKRSRQTSVSRVFH